MTTHNVADMLPDWEPDGRGLVFSSSRDAPGFHLFRVLADGTSTPEAITFGVRSQFSASFTPDGNTILYSELSEDEGFDIYSLSSEGEGVPQVLIKTRFNEGNAVVSPDGEWVAYISDETGQPEIYVQAYPKLGRRTQISAGGGSSPVWARDGTELFYRSPTAMMGVKIQWAIDFEAGIPEELFPDEYYRDPQLSRTYDVSPLDGRFLMMKNVTDGAVDRRNELMLVENWFEELKRLAPPDGAD